MKTAVGVICTILVEITIVFVIGRFIGWTFVDLTFFLGLLFVVVSYFASSKGGFFSNAARLQAQAQSGIKIEGEKHVVEWNVFFIGSLVYTVLSFLLMVASYWTYFTK